MSSPVATISGFCSIDYPKEKFEKLNKEYEEFVAKASLGKLVSLPIFEIKDLGEKLSLEIYPCDGLSEAEWYEFDCWLKLTVEDFFKPRKIKVYGDFHCDEGNDEPVRFIVTKKWGVRFQTSTLKWSRLKTWDRKFPEGSIYEQTHNSGANP